MLYIEFHERGKYPLLIEAKKLVKGDIKRNIRRTFEEQYECDDNIFENYCQFDNKIRSYLLIIYKIILIILLLL